MDGPCGSQRSVARSWSSAATSCRRSRSRSAWQRSDGPVDCAFLTPACWCTTTERPMMAGSPLERAVAWWASAGGSVVDSRAPHPAGVTSSWTGPIDRSRNGLPFFGSLGGHPDVFFGVGYSGNGVGPSFVGGRILASLALGLDDEWSGCGLVGLHPGGFPPEPVRYAGALGVREAIQRKERVEDRGGRAGPVTRALVRLAPAGLVPAKRG